MNRSFSNHSRRVRKGHSLWSGELVAGWVFADMLLVLFIVGLGMATPTPSEPAAQHPSVETPKATKPTEQPKNQIIGMETSHHDVHLHFSGTRLLRGETAAASGICVDTRLRTKAYEQRRSGLVLIFGGSTDPGTGQAIARRIGGQLRCANRALFRDDTVVRYFWDGGLSVNDARIETYLFSIGKTRR